MNETTTANRSAAETTTPPTGDAAQRSGSGGALALCARA